MMELFNIDFSFGFGFGMVFGSIIATIIVNILWNRHIDKLYVKRSSYAPDK